jgi:hypothetical protein
MPTSHVPYKPKSLLRRAERVLVGFMMSVMAFFLEKIVMRGVRKKGGSTKAPKHGGLPEGTAITTKGGAIDFEPEP